MCGKGGNHIHVFRDCFNSRAIWNMVLYSNKNIEKPNMKAFMNSDWKTWMSINTRDNQGWMMVFGVTI